MREIAQGHCEASIFTLVRLEGPISERHDSPRHTPTQRGRVRHCPCCASAPRVAIPGSYRLGSYDGLRSTGIRLWAGEGPWAQRCLAAADYALRRNDCMPLSTGRDWAAKSPEVHAPDPLVRGVFRGDPLLILTIAQERAETSEKKEMDTETKKDAPDMKQDVPSYSSLGLEVSATDGPLLPDSLLPQGDNAQQTPPPQGPGYSHTSCYSLQKRILQRKPTERLSG